MSGRRVTVFRKGENDGLPGDTLSNVIDIQVRDNTVRFDFADGTHTVYVLRHVVMWTDSGYTTGGRMAR